MDITTRYLGRELKSPLVCGASPLSEEPDNIKRMEDAGAGAVVFHSLFEEQLRKDRVDLDHYLNYGAESFPEALTYVPEPDRLEIGPETYLRHLAAAKQAVEMPVFASLNGSTAGGWIDFAREIEQTGVDGLELNIYSIPTDPHRSAESIESEYLEIVGAVDKAVSIPIAVKLSPFFTNFAGMAARIDQAGAHALVLFNRFYQPDIELETLEIRPNILLSTPMAMRLPLRWIAILYGKVGADLAATSGIHRASDALKMIMAGASVTQLCSVLLRRGISHIQAIENDLRHWMAEHEYESIEEMRGSLSQIHCPDSAAFERSQYIRGISHYHTG